MTFVTPDELCEFKALPFGLRLAPATLQRMMDSVLGGLKWHVIVFSPSFEEHLHRRQLVLEAMRSADLTIQPEECHFGYKQLRFLGHVISAGGVYLKP